MSRQENANRPEQRARSPNDEARDLLESTTVAPVDVPAFRRRLADILVRAARKVYAKGRDRQKHRST